MGRARQGQERNAFFHVSAAGLQMARHVPLASIQLITPLCRHPAIEVVGDVAVQLVDIDRLKPVLQPVDLRPQAAHGFIVFALLDREALPERPDDQVINRLTEPQPGQHLTELFFQHLFTHKSLGAFPVIAGAMVVDVFALLDLGGERAAAMAAANQAGEGELTHAAAGLGIARLLVAAVQNLLNAGP